MKVLILGLNFAPELTGVGRYTGDFAAWLSERGHEVHVITAPPYYPEWRVGPGYTARTWRRETAARVQVLRCPVWVPPVLTPMTRILHLLSFAMSSLVPCLWQAARFRPDLVWAVEPTSFAAPTVLLAARLCRGRACLHVQDLEAEAACRLGPVRAPLLRRLLHRAYGWLVRRFDLVSTICLRMQARLREFGVAEERLCLFPNWVDTDAIRPLAGPSILRRQWGCADTQVIALYAGSMSDKQGLEILADVAERLRAHPDIRLVLCGAGAARPRLERRLAGCANVLLLPLQPEVRLNALLNAADIHLLPQRAEAETFALPSKLAAILASGRPLIAQAEGGELAAATRRCGILVAPGDASAMAAAITELAADPKRRRRLGQIARQLAEDHLDREAIVARYEQRLSWLVSSRAAGSRAARAGAGHMAPRVPQFAARTPAQLRRG
ncbi:MAG TPA: WcaI family glycosyltransferase [Geminicoccaceae bacterium]